LLGHPAAPSDFISVPEFFGAPFGQLNTKVVPRTGAKKMVPLNLGIAAYFGGRRQLSSALGENVVS